MAEINLKIGEVTLKVNSDELTQGIEKGEITVKADDLIVKPKTDYETFLTNVKNEEYNNGKVKGVEMMIKEAREKHGLTFEGKSMDNFADAYKTKVLEEAKIEPSKKIQELESDKEKLQNMMKEKDLTYTNLLNQQENEKKQNKISTSILKKLPKDGLLIPQDDLLTLIKTKAAFDTEGENIVIKKDGEVIKNQSTLNPITIEEWLPEIIKPYIKLPKGGAGGGDESGQNKPGSFAAFNKEMAEKSIKEGSEAYNIEMQKRLKEKTLTM